MSLKIFVPPPPKTQMKKNFWPPDTTVVKTDPSHINGITNAEEFICPIMKGDLSVTFVRMCRNNT